MYFVSSIFLFFFPKNLTSFNFSDIYCYQFQQEIPPHVGKVCKSSYDKTAICDGSKGDCVKEGKDLCLSDPNCYGIMYDSAWGLNGVKICTSWTLKENPGKDWSVFMRCSDPKEPKSCPGT